MAEINIESIQNVIQGQNDPKIGTERGIPFTNITTPEILYTRAIYLLVWAVGLIAILVLIYGGFTYMTAGADAEKAERAKKIIVGTVIGMLIIIASYMIYSSIVKTVTSWEPRQQISREV